MIGEAIKLFEMLVKRLEHGEEVDQRFFPDVIQPLYKELEIVYDDYISALGELYCLLGREDSTQESLIRYIRGQKANQETRRIQLRSLAEQLTKTSSFRKMNADRQRWIKEFSDRIEEFFTYYPNADIFRHCHGSSYYWAILEGISEAAEKRERISIDSVRQDVESLDSMRGDLNILRAAVLAITAQELPKKWIAISDAYAQIWSSFK